MSRIVCTGIRRGHGPTLERFVSEDLQAEWIRRLCESLHMTYTTESGLPPKYGDHVVAHPQFDAKLVKRMDAELGRKWGSKLYAKAFALSKPRADDMLASFVASQHITNRPYFKNCLRRLQHFATPEVVELLARPVNK